MRVNGTPSTGGNGDCGRERQHVHDHDGRRRVPQRSRPCEAPLEGHSTVVLGEDLSGDDGSGRLKPWLGNSGDRLIGGRRPG